ncbi:MAG: thioesterase family protein [Caulobacteraceae bacterium]|nr:thioesterase family protein [Caulobacteraceae bacterium]
MDNQAFFTRDGAGFLANPVSRGPWNPQSLHGRVVIGLLAFAIEERCGDPAYTPARLTVDMYRLPDFSPLSVETRLVRDGHRIKVVDAELFSAGVSVGRATSQLLRRTEQPPGRVWSPPDWDAPKPWDIAPPSDARVALGGMWAVRPIVGAMGTLGPRRMWMAEVRELVEGSPLTPWVRAALASDFASPFANAGDAGLAYINTDVTLYMHRPPQDEWIGFEVVNHQSADGVAIGECWLYDVNGPVGAASVCALAQKRAMGPGAP